MPWHPQLTCQDRIDGGISILLRSPGYHIDDMTMTHNLVIDMYCTPCTVAQGGSQITSSLAVIAQSFAQDLVMLYLHQFQEHCEAEHVSPLALLCMFFFLRFNLFFLTLWPAHIPHFIRFDKNGWLRQLLPFLSDAGTHWRFACWPGSHTSEHTPRLGDDNSHSVDCYHTLLGSESDGSWWNEASSMANTVGDWMEIL